MDPNHCIFPGCTGTYDPELAQQEGFTGWRFSEHEADVPVHDCETPAGVR